MQFQTGTKGYLIYYYDIIVFLKIKSTINSQNIDLIKTS